MPCHHFTIKDADGKLITGSVRMAAARLRWKCSGCGRMHADRRCDGPAGAEDELFGDIGRTCDRSICGSERCSTHVKPDKDFCKRPACQEAAREAQRDPKRP